MDLNKWNTNFVWNVSTHDAQTARSLSFSSGLVRAVHARASGEAARRAKRGRVSRFARRTTEKRETARSLHGAYLLDGKSKIVVGKSNSSRHSICGASKKHGL